MIHRCLIEQSAGYTLLEWRMMKEEGLDRGLLRAEESYKEARTQYRIWWSGVALLGVVGVGLIAAGIFMGRPFARSTKPACADSRNSFLLRMVEERQGFSTTETDFQGCHTQAGKAPPKRW